VDTKAFFKMVRTYSDISEEAERASYARKVANFHEPPAPAKGIERSDAGTDLRQQGCRGSNERCGSGIWWHSGCQSEAGLGVMYNRALADLDDHVWEAVWMDPTAIGS
jgi:hypothetical protein